jgi:hypothetical protein
VQRLHAPVHDFRKAGDVGDVGDGKPRVAQRFGGAAGRDELHAGRDKRAGKIGKAGFVGNGEQRAADGSPGHARLLTPEQPKEKGEHDADHKRCDNGEVEAEIAAFKRDVAREPSEPNSAQERPGETGDEKDHARGDQDATSFETQRFALLLRMSRLGEPVPQAPASARDSSMTS